MPLDRARIRVVFLVVGIMAGIPLFLVGLYSNIDSIRFHSKAVPGEGRIYDVDARGTNLPWGKVYVYHYGVEFGLPGKTVRANSVSEKKYQEGEWVRLLYNPADPGHARIADGSRDLFMNLVCFLPGLGLVIGAGFILYCMKRGMY